MYELFLRKTKKGITIVNPFQSVLDSSERKYGLIKAVNLITVLLKMVHRELHRTVFNM